MKDKKTGLIQTLIGAVILVIGIVHGSRGFV